MNLYISEDYVIFLDKNFEELKKNESDMSVKWVLLSIEQSHCPFKSQESSSIRRRSSEDSRRKPDKEPLYTLFCIGVSNNISTAPVFPSA